MACGMVTFKLLLIFKYKLFLKESKMEGWKYWEGKKVFILLKNKRTYQGIVLEVETNTLGSSAWIIIKDKFEKRVSFITDEIEVIQEEKNGSS